METVSKAMVDRLLVVLDRCVESREPIPLARLYLQCGLPKATTWRIAEALAGRGLVTRTADGYLAGAGLLQRAERAAHQLALREVVLPELVELHRQTDGAVWAVAVSRALDWLVIAQVYGRTAVRDRYSERWQHDPTKPAILATSLGIVGLADRADQVDELLSRGIPRLTRHTEVNPGRIIDAFRLASEERRIVEHGRVWLGWSCLAVPIFDAASERTVGVLGVTDRTPRFSSDRLSRATQSAADRLRSQWPAPRTPAA